MWEGMVGARNQDGWQGGLRVAGPAQGFTCPHHRCEVPALAGLLCVSAETPVNAATSESLRGLRKTLQPDKKKSLIL